LYRMSGPGNVSRLTPTPPALVTVTIGRALYYWQYTAVRRLQMLGGGPPLQYLEKGDILWPVYRIAP